MARCAGCDFMSTFEHKSCCLVVERGIASHLPRIGTVANVARDLDIAVRRFLRERDLCNEHHYGKHAHHVTSFSPGGTIHTLSITV